MTKYYLHMTLATILTWPLEVL